MALTEHSLTNKICLILCLFAILTISKTTAQDTQTGRATYYSKRFHNKKTASGEVYHTDSLTCAHKKYPFGTKLLVKNLANGKEVVVKVNDRGPLKGTRIIDLSYKAAEEIDMVKQGVARVEVSKYIESETEQDIPKKELIESAPKIEVKAEKTDTPKQIEETPQPVISEQKKEEAKQNSDELSLDLFDEIARQVDSIQNPRNEKSAQPQTPNKK